MGARLAWNDENYLRYDTQFKVILERFKKETKKVYKEMHDIKDQQENSGDVDQTNNADRTDSERSDTEQE